jgi:hypothetical protein
MVALLSCFWLLFALCSCQGLNVNETWNLSTVLGGQAQLTNFTAYLNLYPSLLSTLSDANFTSMMALCPPIENH